MKILSQANFNLLPQTPETNVLHYWHIAQMDATHPMSAKEHFKQITQSLLNKKDFIRSSENTFSSIAEAYHTIGAVQFYVNTDILLDFAVDGDDAVSMYVDGRIVVGDFGSGGVDGLYYKYHNAIMMGQRTTSSTITETLYPAGYKVGKGWHTLLILHREVSGSDTVVPYIRLTPSPAEAPGSGTVAGWAQINTFPTLSGNIVQWKEISPIEAFSATAIIGGYTDSGSVGGYSPSDFALVGHNHNGVYEPVISSKKTAFNVDFGTTSGTAAQGNHTHSQLHTQNTDTGTTSTIFRFGSSVASDGSGGGMGFSFGNASDNYPYFRWSGSEFQVYSSWGTTNTYTSFKASKFLRSDGTEVSYSDHNHDTRYDARYLSLTGGTLSNDLYIDRNAADSSLIFKNNGSETGRLRINTAGDAIFSGTSGSMYLRPAGNTNSTSEVKISASAFTYNNNTIYHSGNLDTSKVVWNNQNNTITGTLNVTGLTVTGTSTLTGNTSITGTLSNTGNTSFVNGYFQMHNTNEFNASGTMYINYRRGSDSSTTNAPDTVLNLNSGKVGIGVNPTEKLDIAGNMKVSGIIKTNKSCWQVTIPAGSTRQTVTHSFGTTSYMVALGANSLARHVAWENKATNTVDIVIDSPYSQAIVIDVIILGY